MDAAYARTFTVNIIIIKADGLPGDCLVFRANQGSSLVLKIFQCLLFAINGPVS